MNTAKFNMFSIALSKDEIQQAEGLLTEIRNIIRDSETIENDHKRRLLSIANKFQAELDKSRSSLRVFFDGLIEGSKVLGEVGENIKPLLDRFNEVAGIVNKAGKTQEALEAPKELLKLTKQDPAAEEDND